MGGRLRCPSGLPMAGYRLITVLAVGAGSNSCCMVPGAHHKDATPDDAQALAQPFSAHSPRAVHMVKIYAERVGRTDAQRVYGQPGAALRPCGRNWPNFVI